MKPTSPLKSWRCQVWTAVVNFQVYFRWQASTQGSTQHTKHLLQRSYVGKCHFFQTGIPKQQSDKKIHSRNKKKSLWWSMLWNMYMSNVMPLLSLWENLQSMYKPSAILTKRATTLPASVSKRTWLALLAMSLQYLLETYAHMHTSLAERKICAPQESEVTFKGMTEAEPRHSTGCSTCTKYIERPAFI